MEKSKSTGDTAIYVTETRSTKGKAVEPPPTVVAATTKAATVHPKGGGWKKGLAIMDFFLRLCAIAAALAATTSMGTTDQTLPFFTQFFQFHAEYSDLPTFSFFVVANALAAGYLVLSLPFSVISIVRPHATGARLLLLICDTVMEAFTISAASAAAAIVYLAHNGNQNSNWFAICQQFNDFCKQVSGAVVASFIASVFFMSLIVLAAIALRKS